MVKKMVTELDEKRIKKIFPIRKKDSKKGDNGKVLVIGGSKIYHGAPLLTGLAAYRSGVDLVYMAIPKPLVIPVRSYSPSMIVLPLPDVKITEGGIKKIIKYISGMNVSINSAVLGPGIGKSKNKYLSLLIHKLQDNGIKIVVDADALTGEIIENLDNDNTVITPHIEEFRRIFGYNMEDISHNRIEVLEETCKNRKMTILLKGQTDIISNGRETYVNLTGNSGMTVGGTGDILSGIVGGMIARGASLIESACIATYINGLSGDYAVKQKGFHILPDDIINELPNVMKRFDKIV